MKFSIITPSFNQVGFIEETLKSVLSQGVDLEYWVIDGGSKDGTLKILEKYNKKFKSFNFISEPDSGQSEAINKGIKKSTGDIIAYLNSDDTYCPNALKTVEEYVLKYPTTKWFYGKSIIVDIDNLIIKHFFTKVKNFLGKKYSYWKLLSFNIISQPAVFLKKELIAEYGLFGEENHLVMDYEYWLRIGKNQPLLIDKNLSRYRIHGEAKSVKGFFKQYFHEFLTALGYIKLKYFHCAIIHFFHLFLASLWMQSSNFKIKKQRR